MSLCLPYLETDNEPIDDVTYSFKFVRIEDEDDFTQRSIIQAERLKILEQAFEPVNNHGNRFESTPELEMHDFVSKKFRFQTSVGGSTRNSLDRALSATQLGNFVVHKDEISTDPIYMTVNLIGDWFIQITMDALHRETNAIDAQLNYELCLIQDTLNTTRYQWTEFDATINRIEFVLWQLRFSHRVQPNELQPKRKKTFFFIGGYLFRYKQKNVYNCDSQRCKGTGCNAKFVFSVFGGVVGG